ncbi:MAG TPA: alpha/beta fold hydrolase, partial [Rhodocyclaceae bacterium]|nr:alpha/beta fold hydrolase [Rhodocyclaceae bacterium]
ALPGLAVLTPDLPGHGDAPRAGPQLADWSDAVAVGLPKGCTLAGWSLGALLALDIARRHPDKVARLILTGASPRFTATDDWPCALSADTLRDFRAGFGADPDATQRRFVALQALGDHARRNVTQTLTAALTPADTAHREALADGLALLADTDLRPILPAIAQPVRLLHGARDALMPVAAAEHLADALPHARLSIFADSGHAPFLSRPDDFATLVEGARHD